MGIGEPPIDWQKKKIEERKKKAAQKSSGGSGPLSGLLGGISVGQPATQASSLAESIERQANNQAQQAQQKSGLVSTNPFDLLQQQLFSQANSIPLQLTPYEQLKQMAQDQVGLQYDPMIAALQNEMGIHEKRGNKSAQTARDMYGSLAQDYLSQLPQMTSQFKAEDDATNQRYDQSQAQMADQYQKQAADQDAIMKRLGIQAAAPEATQQTKEDQAYFQNQAEMDQQNALSALNQQQMAQQNYQQNLGSNAKMAGENTAQDILSQLGDYMDQAGSQMTSLQGQKSSAIAALLQQMQSQDSQRAEQQRQQEFQNMMSMFNFQLDAQKAANSASNNSGFGGTGAGASGLTTGLPGAENYLASQYPNQPILASNLMGLINNVLSNKDVTSGKFVLDPGNPSMGQAPKYSDVGQQYMEDLLRRQFEQQGNRYNTGDINATIAALEAYLGKLR